MLRGSTERAIAAVELELTSKQVVGIDSPLPALNEILKPLRPGQLVYLSGCPGSGKSSLALQWAWHAAFNRHKNTLYFSLEMNHEELGERLLIAANQGASVERALIAGKSLPADEAISPLRSAARAFKDLPLHIICPRGPLHPSDIALYGRMAKIRRGLDFIVLDYLYLLRPDKKTEGETEKMNELTVAMKTLATQLQVPVLCLHSLSREVENKRPRIPTDSGLRGSQQLNYDANAIIILYRPGYYYQKDGNWKENELASKELNHPFLVGDDETTMIKVDKQRRGPGGHCFARFVPAQTWFDDGGKQ